MLYTLLCAALVFVLIAAAMDCLGLAVKTWGERPPAPKHKPTMGKPLRVALIVFFIACVLVDRYA